METENEVGGGDTEDREWMSGMHETLTSVDGMIARIAQFCFGFVCFRAAPELKYSSMLPLKKKHIMGLRTTFSWTGSLATTNEQNKNYQMYKIITATATKNKKN